MKHEHLLRALRHTQDRPPVSRRQFIRTGLGAAAVGAVVGPQLLHPSTAYAAGDDPIPVGGSPFLAPFHVWTPITNFNGVAAIAYVSGNVRRTHLQTGAVDLLSFLDADMRFMQGVYRGADGKPRQGTFGFV